MKILMAGEGGQGVQLAAEVLAHAAFLENKNSSFIPNFGVEQRGGVSLAFIKINEGSYPKFDKADILAIFCDRAFERVKNYVDQGTKIIAGPAVNKHMGDGLWHIVRNRGLPAKVWNILILARIVEISGIVNKESIRKALEDSLGEKFKENPNLRELNLKALK